MYINIILNKICLNYPKSKQTQHLSIYPTGVYEPIKATRHNSADSVPTSTAVCILEAAVGTTFSELELFTKFAALLLIFNVPVKKCLQQTFLTKCVSK